MTAPKEKVEKQSERRRPRVAGVGVAVAVTGPALMAIKQQQETDEPHEEPREKDSSDAA